LKDAAMYNGKILLHDESQDGKILAQFENVSADTVLTPRYI
jgi:hypothetical protein